MKYKIEQIKQGDDELILRYQNLNQEVEHIMNFMSFSEKKLVGTKNGYQIVVDVKQILYIESVDRKTFVYLEDDVVRVEYTLTQLERMLNSLRFFRCSKSMIMNIDKVKVLDSLASNRIDATMCNGEHIIISRTYASEFRRRLKGEAFDE
ncbi:MAG: LytTR family transcriptional regulator [Lachnospiraceae bacterium]|nr:LytTR family transcriptional regulator [Lachnospiraceae bacterium]